MSNYQYILSGQSEPVVTFVLLYEGDVVAAARVWNHATVEQEATRWAHRQAELHQKKIKIEDRAPTLNYKQLGV